MSNRDLRLLKYGVRAPSSPYLTCFEPFRMKKFNIIAQENNLVCLFGEMTNSSAFSE